MTASVEIVIEAQDKASKPIATIEGHLLKMSKDARLLKRETRGVMSFANALDTIAGTQFGSVIGDIQTVAEVGGPLKQLGAALSARVSDAWGAVAAQPKVAAAIDKAGALMSSRLGTAIKAAGVVVVAAAITDVWLSSLSEAKTRVENDPKSVTPIQMFDARAPMWAQAKVVAAQQMQTIGQGALDAFNKTWNDGIANGIKPDDPALLAAAKAAGEAAGGVVGTSAVSAAGTAADPLASVISHSLSEHADDLKAAATNVGSDMGKALAAKEIWDKSARAITGDLASTLQGNTDVIKTAMDKVAYAITHPLELAAAEARIQGALATLQYKRGLASNSDEVNAVIDQQIAALEAQWQQLSGKAYDAGANAANRWKNGYVQQFSGNKVNLPGYQGGGKEPPVPHGLPHRAGGGPTMAGQTYLVGERGPEMLHMGNSSGYVSPNSGRPLVVNIDGRKLFEIMDERMGKRLVLTSSSTYTRG